MPTSRKRRQALVAFVAILVIVLGIGYSQRLAAGAILLIAMSLRAAVARVERWSAR